MTDVERKLFDKAVTALVCALAHDEAVLHGKDLQELAALRNHWVPDAEAVVEDAERLGLWGDFDEDDEDDFDDEEEDFDDDDER
jgi:hypothetical protein